MISPLNPLDLFKMTRRVKKALLQTKGFKAKVSKLQQQTKGFKAQILEFQQQTAKCRKITEQYGAKVDALESQSAWDKFSFTAFQKRLDKKTCEGRMIPICCCRGCYLSYRFDSSVLSPSEIHKYFGGVLRKPPCVILHCLKFHAQRLGLTLTSVDLDVSDDEDAFGEHHKERDSHLVIYWKHDEWWVEYGTKLARKNFHLNPDVLLIKELMRLFPLDEFFVAEEDYNRKVYQESMTSWRADSPAPP